MRARAIGAMVGTGALAACSLALPAATGAQNTGGTSSTPSPSIASLHCPTGCDELEPGRAGDVLRIAGRHLDTATGVAFLGGRGAADDVHAPPRRRSPRALDVMIPTRARSGPVQVLGADPGAASAPSRGTVALGTRGAWGQPREIAGGPVVAHLSARTMFFGGRRRAELAYTVRGAVPLALRVELVRVSDGTVVARWTSGEVAPGVPQVAAWDGLAGGRVPADGRFQFRIYAGAQAPAPVVADSFLFISHVFPIRGRHDYGTNVNLFGAISGRGHLGQDVLAGCGTPLVAARGGVVKLNRFQSAAGNYVVIDEAGSRFDHAYMHLRERAIVQEGQQVGTGQLIAHVGTTGSSTACHLHFELWDGPWWDGGHPIDPLPHLKAWDRATALAGRAAR